MWRLQQWCQAQIVVVVVVIQHRKYWIFYCAQHLVFPLCIRLHFPSNRNQVDVVPCFFPSIIETCFCSFDAHPNPRTLRTDWEWALEYQKLIGHLYCVTRFLWFIENLCSCMSGWLRVPSSSTIRRQYGWLRRPAMIDFCLHAQDGEWCARRPGHGSNFRVVIAHENKCWLRPARIEEKSP